MTAIYLQKKRICSTVYVESGENLLKKMNQLKADGYVIIDVRELKTLPAPLDRFGVIEYRGRVWADGMTQEQAEKELNRLQKEFPTRKFIVSDLRLRSQMKKWNENNRAKTRARYEKHIKDPSSLSTAQKKLLAQICNAPILCGACNFKTVISLKKRDLIYKNGKAWVATQTGREWLEKEIIVG